MSWLDKATLAVIDTETTGLDPSKDRVIEVAGVLVVARRVVSQFQTFVSVPDAALASSGEAFKVNGINPEDVKRAPTFKHAIWGLRALVRSAHAVVGHNVAFDIDMLTAEYHREGKEPPEEFERLLCTQAMAFATDPPIMALGLQKVAAKLNIEPAQAHRAMGDVQTTFRCLPKLVERAGLGSLSLEAAMRENAKSRSDVRDYFRTLPAA